MNEINLKYYKTTNNKVNALETFIILFLYILFILMKIYYFQIKTTMSNKNVILKKNEVLIFFQ